MFSTVPHLDLFVLSFPLDSLQIQHASRNDSAGFFILMVF